MYTATHHPELGHWFPFFYIDWHWYEFLFFYTNQQYFDIWTNKFCNLWVKTSVVSVTYCCPSRILRWSAPREPPPYYSRQTAWVSPSSISILTSDRWNGRRFDLEWDAVSNKEQVVGDCGTYLHAGWAWVTHEVFLPQGRKPGSFLTLLISFDRQPQLAFTLLPSFHSDCIAAPGPQLKMTYKCLCYSMLSLFLCYALIMYCRDIPIQSMVMMTIISPLQRNPIYI